MTECLLYKTCQGTVTMVARLSVMLMAVGREWVVGARQVEEQKNPNAEWILKVDVEATKNCDSIGVERKPEGESVG